MIRKIFVGIFLISIIFAQISWAKPQPKDLQGNLAVVKNKDLCLLKTKYGNDDSTQNESLLSPSNQLLNFTIKSFQDLSVKYIIKAKNISEHMLRNNEILTGQTPKILEFKRNLTQFEENYSLCDGIDQLFELVELYSNTTSFYFELDETSLDKDAKLILGLLRKFGSEDLDEEFMKLFSIFVDKFIEKFEGLKQAIRKEEGQLGKEMLEWFKHFKTLTDDDDKIGNFETFFLLFEEDQLE